MSALNKAQLINEIISKILSGNSNTTAQNLRTLLNDYLDSYPNLLDGGYLFESELGYKSAITVVDGKAFLSLSQAQAIVAAAISGIDLSGLMPKSAGSGNPFTGDVYLGSHGIFDTTNPILLNRKLYDSSGSIVADFSSQSNGFGIKNSAGYTTYLKGLNSSGNTDISFQDGVSGTVAYLQNIYDAIAGLKFKTDVRLCAVGNVDISNSPDVFDGVNANAGDRILLTEQSDGTQNGIYIFTALGDPLLRASDADTGTELANKTIPVNEGSVNAEKWFTVTNDSITMGLDVIYFTQTSGSTYTAGDGLQLIGTQFSLNGTTLRTDGSVVNDNTQDWGGFGINNIDLLKDFSEVESVSVNDRYLADQNGKVVAEWLDILEGFVIYNNDGWSGKLDMSDLTDHRVIKFQDKAYSGVADLTDIPSLAGYATITGTETLTNKTLTSPVINVGSDATGDTYYRSSGGAFNRLGIGSTNAVYTVTAGIPSWKSIATILGYTPADDSSVVHISGTETITGSKTFNFQTLFNGGIVIENGQNVNTGTGTGSSFGQGTTAKISFYGKTPIVQPANTVALDTLLINTGLWASGATNSTFDKNILINGTTTSMNAPIYNVLDADTVTWKKGFVSLATGVLDVGTDFSALKFPSIIQTKDSAGTARTVFSSTSVSLLNFGLSWSTIVIPSSVVNGSVALAPTGSGDVYTFKSSSSIGGLSGATGNSVSFYSLNVVNQSAGYVGRSFSFAAVPTLTSVISSYAGFYSNVGSPVGGGGNAYSMYHEGSAPSYIKGKITTDDDFEITANTKGVILKDTVTSSRYRISVTSGVVVATAI